MTDSLERVLTTATSGMSAQSIRMGTISSNLANAGSVGTTEDSTYHGKTPIFSEVTQQIIGLNASDQPIGGVRVTDIQQSQKPLEKRYEPGNPLANSDGYVFVTDVNPIEEMTNMIDASKQYEANVQLINTTKSLLQHSIDALK